MVVVPGWAWAVCSVCLGPVAFPGRVAWTSGPLHFVCMFLGMRPGPMHYSLPGNPGAMDPCIIVCMFIVRLPVQAMNCLLFWKQVELGNACASRPDARATRPDARACIAGRQTSPP